MEALSAYSTCDVSDALLKLGIKQGGVLNDLTLRTRIQDGMMIGRAYTVRFSTLPVETTNIPAGQHYIDSLPKDAVILLQQPDQSNACFGGIMAARAHHQQVAAILVDGRVRDLNEMRALGLPVFSRGKSIVGAGAGCKPSHVQVPLTFGDLTVEPNDWVMIDSEGICVVPQHIDLRELISLMDKLTAQDDKVMKAVKEGMTVKEAFTKYRG